MVPLAHRSRPLRVLAIEEDPVQRKLLQACLEVLQAEMLVAPRAANAVWLLGLGKTCRWRLSVPT